MTAALGVTNHSGVIAPALSVDHLEAGYGRLTVLRDVSLTIPQNSVTALIGPNGAGKTTLLKTICGLLPARSGRILLDGEDITKLEHYKRVDRGLCHIPEGRGIYRSLTVRENLQMQATKKAESRAIERAVSIFPVLGQRLSQVAGTMSGGEQQMLAMAGAYSRDSRIVLVDEPSLGLAPLIVDVIFEFLESLASREVALLLVDQYIVRALSMAISAYVLRQGEIVYEGDAHDLLGDDIFEHYIGE